MSTGTLYALAGVLFFLFSAVHIVCGDFPKSIDVMPDEMRYLDTARSLFSGDGLIMRGEASSFQKILYPLSLFPALMFPDSLDQVRAINVLSSVYACSAVFPALAIARRLFRNPLPIIASMAFTLLLPDLMYSMTFMTETVFLPLSLWLILLCWRCFESHGLPQLAMALGAGFLCYLAYLCKEVAWMYLIAFLAWFIVRIVSDREGIQQKVMAMGLFLIGFLLPFLVMKLTLFSGLMNSYSQFSFDILLSPYTVLFGLYSLATDSVYFIIGFGVFPIIYVACTALHLQREDRSLAFFCLVSLVIGLAVVIFTISMREDVGHVTLRQHLRYVIPLSLPLLMLFMKQVARLDPVRALNRPRQRSLLVGCTVAFCVLTMAYFGSANLQQGFDNSQFHFMRWLLSESEPLAQDYFDSWGQVMSGISPDDGDLLVIDPVNWACRALVVLFAGCGMLLLFSKRESVRLSTGACICTVITVLMVANSVMAFHYNRGAYGAEPDEITEICAIDDILHNREPYGQVLVTIDDKNTKSNNLIDTYLQDGPGNYRYLDPDDLVAFLDTDIETPLSGPTAPISYLLVNKSQHVKIVQGQVDVVDDGFQDGRFTLYHVTGEEPLKVLVS